MDKKDRSALERELEQLESRTFEIQMLLWGVKSTSDLLPDGSVNSQEGMLGL